MKRLLALATTAAAIAAALVVPTSALASTSQVSAFGCFNNGGQASVPAGNEIVVRQGILSKTRGLTQDFLNAQTSMVSVNGGALDDVSSDWTDPAAVSNGWLTVLLDPTGIALASGQSMTFHLTISVSHLLLDGLSFENGVSGKPAFFGPGLVADLGVCTVTGV